MKTSLETQAWGWVLHADKICIQFCPLSSNCSLEPNIIVPPCSLSLDTTLTKALLMGSFLRAPPREAPWKERQGAGLVRVFAAQPTDGRFSAPRRRFACLKAAKGHAQKRGPTLRGDTPSFLSTSKGRRW